MNVKSIGPKILTDKRFKEFDTGDKKNIKSYRLNTEKKRCSEMKKGVKE